MRKFGVFFLVFTLLLAQTSAFTNSYKDVVSGCYAATDGTNRMCVKENENGTFQYTIGGAEQRQYKKLYAPIYFPNSVQYMYKAELDDDSGLEVMVVNGRQLTGVEMIYDPFFANQGDSYAFPALIRDSVYTYFVNGYMGGEYAKVDEIIFTSDGNHYAYAAYTHDGKMLYIINGYPDKEYVSVSGIQLSLDGKTSAYIAKLENGNSIIVINSIESKEYKRVSDFRFTSYDGDYSYSATELEGNTVIITQDTKPEVENPSTSEPEQVEETQPNSTNNTNTDNNSNNNNTNNNNDNTEREEEKTYDYKVEINSKGSVRKELTMSKYALQQIAGGVAIEKKVYSVIAGYTDKKLVTLYAKVRVFNIAKLKGENARLLVAYIRDMVSYEIHSRDAIEKIIVD